EGRRRAPLSERRSSVHAVEAPGNSGGFAHPGTGGRGAQTDGPGDACTMRRANIACQDRRASPAPAQRPRSCEGVAPVGDTGSTRPMRGVASRVAAAVVGAALAAAMMAVPRDALALQDSIQAAAQRGAGHADAGAASAAS